MQVLGDCLLVGQNRMDRSPLLRVKLAVHIDGNWGTTDRENLPVV
jgi:hypothetical protein